ncbi:MAG: hypothetical protein AB1567_07510 [bacterium]
MVHEKGGRWWEHIDTITDINVSAHSQRSFLYEREVYLSTSTYFGLYIGKIFDTWLFNGAVARCERGVWIVEAEVNLNITTDKKNYAKGETVSTTLKITNEKSIEYETNLQLKVINPKDIVISTKTTTLTLIPKGSATVNFETLLKDDSISGNYIIVAEAYRIARNIVAKSITSFQIPFPEAGISLEVPPDLIPHSTTTISFKITNTGLVDIASGSLNTTLKAPDNSVIFSSGTSSFGTIPISGSITLSFKVPLGSISFGVYKLEYNLSYDGKGLSGKKEISYSPLINCRFDKTWYKVGEPLTGTLTIINTGRFDITVLPKISISAFNYERQLDSISIPVDSPYLILLNIPIPATATSGAHKFKVTIDETNPIIKEFDFVIKKAQLKFTLPKLTYQQGEQGTITIKNIGGVDTTFDYNLTIRDKRGILLDEQENRFTLQPDSMLNQNFNIPEDTLSDTYYLAISCIDVNVKWNYWGFERVINVAGVKPVLNVQTTKQKYLSNENIVGSITINPAVDDATLYLKILKEDEAWTVYTGIGEYMETIGVDGDYVWFGGKYGVARYQKNTGSWTTFTPPDGLKSWGITSIGVDEDAVWFGHSSWNELGYGISRYDKQTGNFNRFTHNNMQVLPKFDVDVIAIDDKYVWISGNCRYDKLNNAFGTYTPPAGELVLGEGYAWYKEMPICKYDAETETLGTKTISVTGKLAVDGDYIWILDTINDKVLRYNTKTNDWQEYSFEPPGYVKDIYCIAVSENYVWVGTYYDIQRYDKKTGNWERITIPENLKPASQYIAVSYIGVDGNYLWLATPTGPIRYDKSSLWENFTMGNGLLSNKIYSIANDEEFIWIGTDKGINKYDKKNDTFIKEAKLLDLNVTYEINVDNDYLWFGIEENGTFSIGRYNKVTGSLTTITIKELGLENSWVSSILSDGNYVWVGTKHGIARYDKVNDSWATFTTLLNNDINAIASDENYVWVGIGTFWASPSKGGLARYDKNLGTWTVFTPENSQLPDDCVYSIANDGDYLWLGTDDNGLVRYDKNTGECKIFNPINSGLIDGLVEDIAVDGDYLWIDASRVVRYNKLTNRWEKFTELNTCGGLMNGSAGEIIVDNEYVWFTTGAGLSRHKRYDEVFKEKVITLNTWNNQPIDLGTITTVGKLYLQGTLISKNEQVLAEDATSFYISDNNLYLQIDVDKKWYKPYEGISITCRVINNSDTSRDNLNLIIKNVNPHGKEGEKVIYEEIINIPANSTYEFTTTTTSDRSFMLEACIGEEKVSEYVQIIEPEIQVEIAAYSKVYYTLWWWDITAKYGTNTLTVSFKNTSRCDINIGVDIDSDGLGLSSKYNNIYIPAGSIKIIQEEFYFFHRGTVTVNISGDINETYSKRIIPAESVVSFYVNVRDVYPEGYIEIPFSIYGSDIDVIATFTLGIVSNQKTVGRRQSESKLSHSKDYSVTQLPGWCLDMPLIKIKEQVISKNSNLKRLNAPTQSIQTTTFTENSIIINLYVPEYSNINGLLIYKLSKGEYELKYEWFPPTYFTTGEYVGSETVRFKVAKENIAKIEELTVDSRQ